MRLNNLRNSLGSGNILYQTIMTIVLSLCDGLFTLKLLQMGHYELNPVMDFFIAIDPFLFVAVKLSALTAALGILLSGRPEGYFGGLIDGRRLLTATALLYSGVVSYEMVLLSPNTALGLFF